MSDLHIDRLTLKLSGLTGAEGRRLAERIAAGLAGAALPSGALARAESFRLDLRAGARSVDELADQVVSGLLRELSRQG